MGSKKRDTGTTTNGLPVRRLRQCYQGDAPKLFIFLVDHLLGHAKQRPDGLNAANMNKSFGGKCPHMRSTLIEHDWEFLGPLTMNPGQRQHLLFQEAESGPFWMTPTERKHVVMRLLPL